MDYRSKYRDEIRRNMSAIQSTKGKTEVALRRALPAERFAALGARASLSTDCWAI